MKKELTASKNECLVRKALFISATLLAVLCAFFLLQSSSKMTVNAAQTGTVISKKLLEDNTYKECASSGLVSVFQKEDNTAYKIVRYDGKIVTIDNSDGVIDYISPCASSGVGYQLLRAYDENGKEALMDYNGNYLTGKREFYDQMSLLDQEQDKDYYYIKDRVLHICAEDGSELCPAFTNVPEDANIEVYSFGEYYTIVNYSDRNSFRIIDQEGNLKKSGTGFGDNACFAVDNYDENGSFTSYTYYDTNLNEIDSPIWSNTTYHNELAPNVKSPEEGKIPSAIAELGIEAMVTIGETTYYKFWNDEGFGLVDGNGNKVFPHADFIGDHIIAVRDDNGYYNALELSSAPTGATSIQLKENGNATASLIAAGTTDILFELNASKDIVPDGCIFKVAKLEDTDKTTTNAKKLLKDIINGERFTAYDISLLNAQNEKVQPKGVLSITTPIPNGYNASRVAVYRINDDNTYTELKSTVANGNITFETDHFSTYVISEKAAVASPNTGDRSSEILWLTLLFIAVIALCSRKLWKQV